MGHEDGVPYPLGSALLSQWTSSFCAALSLAIAPHEWVFLWKREGWASWLGLASSGTRRRLFYICRVVVELKILLLGHHHVCPLIREIWWSLVYSTWCLYKVIIILAAGCKNLSQGIIRRIKVVIISKSEMGLLIIKTMTWNKFFYSRLISSSSSMDLSIHPSIHHSTSTADAVLVQSCSCCVVVLLQNQMSSFFCSSF